ncbi:MAG: hypothetical protein SOI66_01465 [Bifidobacterium sp.]|jgi:hypothetical protein
MKRLPIIIGAISLALGAVSMALVTFEPIAAGVCGLGAGVLGLACGLYENSTVGSDGRPAQRLQTEHDDAPGSD